MGLQVFDQSSWIVIFRGLCETIEESMRSFRFATTDRYLFECRDHSPLSEYRRICPRCEWKMISTLFVWINNAHTICVALKKTHCCLTEKEEWRNTFVNWEMLILSSVTHCLLIWSTSLVGLNVELAFSCNTWENVSFFSPVSSQYCRTSFTPSPSRIRHFLFEKWFLVEFDATLVRVWLLLAWNVPHPTVVWSLDSNEHTWWLTVATNRYPWMLRGDTKWWRIELVQRWPKIQGKLLLISRHSSYRQGKICLRTKENGLNQIWTTWPWYSAGHGSAQNGVNNHGKAHL